MEILEYQQNTGRRYNGGLIYEKCEQKAATHAIIFDGRVDKSMKFKRIKL